MSKLIKSIEENIDIFLNNIKQQAANTKEARLVIEKYFKDGEISEAEEKILQIQLWDSLKIVGVVIPFVLIPGASILMPILIKMAEKHNIELLPTAFKSKKISKDIEKIPKQKINSFWKKNLKN
jgi:hypothetical protein